ncbi:MAG: hypothetical protein ACRC0G_12470 [Fusobacteriaceae bacterium]
MNIIIKMFRGAGLAIVIIMALAIILEVMKLIAIMGAEKHKDFEVKVIWHRSDICSKLISYKGKVIELSLTTKEGWIAFWIGMKTVIYYTPVAIAILIILYQLGGLFNV